MKIKELFLKPIDRPINGVIKADQKDDESIWQELEEYVTTKQVTEYLRSFFDVYLAAFDKPKDPTITSRMGVWVSGFFGSGKSHFIKILSYLLSNLEATNPLDKKHKKAIEFFEVKIKDPMLLADVRRAVTGKTDVILFNIDAKADAGGDRNAILQVFLSVFNELQGFSGDLPYVAEMERHLISKGAYDTFKQSFKVSNGNDWDSERNAAGFYRDDVVKALSQALNMTEESAAKWFDKAADDYSINIEKFADLVKAYLDSKGDGQRIIFLVDEVGQFIGKNTQLMLNLQTITEELGTKCKGRAWVIVTSQEDIDATLGEANQARTNDFSKITARFHTRLSLSSSNTDEVIAHRLLEKTPPALEELKKIFKAKGDIINNQISFADNAVAFNTYKDADDFAIHYPFAPYQFQLLQKVFESIRKVGATGKHLAKGERSMLDAFQTAARINEESDTEVLIPLYDFYPSIESFLDSTVKRAIDQASDNPGLEKWDINLLRALFLIRYADAVKPTIDNLATLSLDKIDADKLALKKKIQDSLNRLEKQNLVNRNGEQWFFLTNEEKDVSQEIKSIDITSSEVSKFITELIFEDALDGINKIKHVDTKSDYEFNRIVDGSPWKQTSNDLNLEVLTPLGADYQLMSEAKCIGRSAEGAGRAILKMANNLPVDIEIRTYLQIEKYIGPKFDTATASLKRILLDRKDENRDRNNRILAQVKQLMGDGEVFILGQKLPIKPKEPTVLLNEIVNYLISNTYSKIGYIKSRVPDPIAEIKAVLAYESSGQKSIPGSGEEINPLAMTEIRQYLNIAASQNRVLLSDVVEKFAKAPWGWRPEWETVLLITRMFVQGEIKLVSEGSDLDQKSAVDPLTKSAKFKQVSILKRKTSDSVTRTKAREIHKELFSLMPPEDEDALVAEFRKNLELKKFELEKAKVKSEQKYYPGGIEVSNAISTIEKQLVIKDPFEFLAKIVSDKDEWLDIADNTQEVLSFYKTQIAVWNKMLEAMVVLGDNRSELLRNEESKLSFLQLETIRANQSPYAQVNQIEGLLAKVEKVNEKLAGEHREKALLAIEQKIKEASHFLSEVKASADLSNSVLKPFQDLKTEIAELSSISKIHYLQARGVELLDEAVDKIEHANKSKPTPPGEAPSSATQVKPVVIIKSSDLGFKPYLETEQEVDDYLKKIREELLKAINAGNRARVQ